MAVVEEVLAGGYVNVVVRIGDTVRRSTSERVEFCHALLQFLEARRWAGSPRLLGTDEQGREILSFLDGHCAYAREQPAGVRSDESLIRVAELVRELHDLTAGSALAGDAEVVCHNDLSPKNTIYRPTPEGYRPMAFIDWDQAAPGPRLHDVAHMCWQFLDLGPFRPDVEEPARRVRMMCDAYGLHDRSGLVDTILWWQDRCWRGIESKAAAGDEAMQRIVAVGGPGMVRDAYDWVRENRATFERWLR